MTFALHLHQGLDEKAVAQMLRVDGLIEAAGIGPTDAIDFLCTDGWVGEPLRIVSIWNGRIGFCLPTYLPSPEERKSPNHIGEESGVVFWSCSDILAMKKFGT